MDKTKITIHKFDNRFILKVGNKFYEKSFLTYICAKNEAINIISYNINDYELIELI